MACKSCEERRKKLKRMKDEAMNKLFRKTPPTPVKKDAD